MRSLIISLWIAVVLMLTEVMAGVSRSSSSSSSRSSSRTSISRTSISSSSTKVKDGRISKPSPIGSKSPPLPPGLATSPAGFPVRAASMPPVKNSISGARLPFFAPPMIRPNRPMQPPRFSPIGYRPRGTAGSMVPGVLAGTAAGAAIGYTAYSIAEQQSARRYWQNYYHSQMDDDDIRCTVKKPPKKDRPDFYERPRVVCGGQVMEYFSCGLDDYYDAGTDEMVGNYCVKSNVVLVEREWTGSEYKYQATGKCPKGYDGQYFGIPGAAIAHCWSQCPAGYTRQKTVYYRHYWSCHRDCEAELPGGLKLSATNIEFCAYKKQ